MEEVSTENAKVSDSGYSNTCSNSQSQRSSGSSISRHSSRSESSGYCGRRPSTLDSSNEALPQPISKRKDKEHKKKKSKAILAVNAEADITLKTAGKPADTVSYDDAVPTKTIVEKKPEEIATVELVDATGPGEHNGDTVTDVQAGLASCTDYLDASTSQANEEFCVVISMHDGLMLYTTPSLCTALGYPKDAWIGRSFMDYVHPKDKATLANHITNGIISLQEDRPKGINGRRISLFCGLRKYARSAVHKSVNHHKEARSNLYFPFHLTLSFRDFRDQTTEQQHMAMFLAVIAQPVHSAYKVPEETIISSVFTTRHTATCHLSHVDPDVVQYFGYLPQDMVGRSLFDFYHPEDLPFIKDIYQTVIKLDGASFRSQPYRFGVQNGGTVVLETDWSSFINPWTKKLEFVVGQHRVLKGPINPDIFRTPSATEHGQLANISAQVLREAKIIREEIRELLSENIQRKSENSEVDLPKKWKDLASFMENLLQETRRPGLSKDATAIDERGFSEHDSVMFGGISPHHEYYDSKSSSETPLSYNQLNYNENIERFFKSKPPVAIMYGSDEDNINFSNGEGGKTSSNSAVRKCMSPINGSGASGSGSAENLSSKSNNQTSSANRGNTSNTTSIESFKPPTLTESLLNRHNEDMEKLMMQKHRALRSSIKNSDKLRDSRIKTTEKMSMNPTGHFTNQGHGVKRSGSHSWEGENFKVSKHDNMSRTSTAGEFPTNVAAATSMSVDQSAIIQTCNINLWNPLSVTVPSQSSAQPHNVPHNTNSQAIPRMPMLPPMLPIYYVPMPQTNSGPAVVSPLQDKVNPPQAIQHPQPNPYMFVPVSYVASTMGGIICPPVTGAPTTGIMYRPFLIPEQTPVSQESNQSIVNKCSDRKRPASQATSVKAESGSTMAMSESSKKVLSPGELFSSCVSNDGGCSSLVENIYTQNDCSVDESSSSSFYSSFLYKSSDSSCNPEQRLPEYLQEDNLRQYYDKLRKEPPWLEDVQLTPELIYEYQIQPKTLSEVLKADMDTLKSFNQPLLVNDQLGQLYLDLEVEGFETKLILEDGTTFSCSDSASSSGSWTMGTMSQQKHRSRMVKYGKLVMIHEENAPLPPPLPSQIIPCQEL